MTGQLAAPELGHCVCGRTLPPGCPSDWACSEVCQSAWFHHQTDPEYPHPREIREKVEQRLALPRAAPARVSVPDCGPQRGGLIAEGTTIDVDGQSYVRADGCWRPAGMWEPLTGEGLAREACYQRWCPHCRLRRPSCYRLEVLAAGPEEWQECAECGHTWAGRSLYGWVETRGAPWPGVRLRLSDGQRSAMIAFGDDALRAHATDQVLVDRMRRGWLRLERQLGGGYADIDEPGPAQLRRQARRRGVEWRA